MRKLLYLLGAAAIAVMLLLLFQATPFAGRPAEALEPRRESNSKSLAPVDRIERTPGSPEERSIRVAVCSTEGTPLRNVVLQAVAAPPTPDRSGEPVNFESLGTTNASGFLELPNDSVYGRAQDILVTARYPLYEMGLVTIPRGAEARDFTIQLRKAASLEVTCLTRQGDAIEGVQLSVSATPLPESREPDPSFERRVSLTSRETAIHRVTTNSEGRATFDDLPRGRLFLQTFHGGFVFVNGTPDGTNVVEIRDALSLALTFDPILCALGVVIDDDVVAWNGSLPQELERSPTISDRLKGTEARWLKQGRNLLCVCGVPSWSEGVYSSPPEFVKFEIFTSSRGRCSVSVPLRASQSWDAPFQVSLGPTIAVPSALAQFVVRTPSGRELHEVTGFTLQPLDANGPARFFIPLQRLAGSRLPVGKYMLATSQPLLRARFSPRMIEVSKDGPVPIDVPEECALCALRWQDAAGLPVDSGEVTIVVDDAPHKIVCTEGLSRQKWYLPVGSARVDIVSGSGKLMGQLLQIPNAASLVSINVGVVR